MTTTERPLRSDAERNRLKLLSCALAAFTELGIEASVDEIAGRAGVGVGTLYRRFPTKQALLDALADGIIDHIVELIEKAQTEPTGHGFEHYFTAFGSVIARYGPALPPLLGGEAPSGRLTREVEPRVRRLMADAQEAGRLRREVTYSDFVVSLWSMAGAVSSTRDVAPDAWKRHAGILLAGLRPPADGARLPGAALTRAQLDQATALRRVAR